MHWRRVSTLDCCNTKAYTIIDLFFATTFVSAGKHRVLAEMRDVAEEVDRIDLEIARAAQQDDHNAMRKVLYEARVAEASVKRVLHHSKELNLDLESPMKAPGEDDDCLSSLDTPERARIGLLKELKKDDPHKDKQTEDSIQHLHTVLDDDKKNRKEAREESQRFLNSLKLALPAPRGMLKNGEPVNSKIKQNLKDHYMEVEVLLTRRFVELKASKSGSRATSVPRPKSRRNSAVQFAGLIADEVKWERPNLSDDDDSSVSFSILNSIIRQAQAAWIKLDSKDYANALAERKARIIKREQEHKTMWLIFYSTVQNSFVQCGILGASLVKLSNDRMI